MFARCSRSLRPAGLQDCHRGKCMGAMPHLVATWSSLVNLFNYMILGLFVTPHHGCLNKPDCEAPAMGVCFQRIVENLDQASSLQIHQIQFNDNALISNSSSVNPVLWSLIFSSKYLQKKCLGYVRLCNPRRVTCCRSKMSACSATVASNTCMT